MTKPVINIADLDYMAFGHGVNFPGAENAPESFEARLGFIGPKVGAQKLGYNLTVVPPGKRAFPFHNHRANEEMFFILEGTGEARIGEARYPVCKGDVVACPPGGPETAHQLINTSMTEELKYLAVSTKLSPEVCDYPDSGKVGVIWDVTPEPGKPPTERYVFRREQGLNYWEGE